MAYMVPVYFDHIFRKARTTNATDSSFPSKVATLTEPPTTTDGVHDIGNVEGHVPAQILVMPYAVAADNNTWNMRLIGWKRTPGATAILWVPCVIAELACTASAAVGVAASDVLDTERFADTITLATGFNSTQTIAVSPTGDVPGHAIILVEGFKKIEFIFDLNVGPPTSMNALWTIT